MRKIIPRAIAFPTLQRYIGHELHPYADQFGITIIKGDKINKGWKGQVLERLAGLDNNSWRAPNGLDFELKSVVFHHLGTCWDPKETMAITMINPDDLGRHEFYESHLWNKLKKLIFCATSYDGSNARSSRLLGVQCFELNQDGNLLDEIKQDYDAIRAKFLTQGFHALTGKDGKWIQARTKGPGGLNKRTDRPNPKTRAFYARKTFIRRIFQNTENNTSLSSQPAVAIHRPTQYHTQ